MVLLDVVFHVRGEYNHEPGAAEPQPKTNPSNKKVKSPVETWDFFGETDTDPRIIDHDEVTRLKRGLDRKKLCYGPDDV